jgi:hypothetical protein
MAKSKDKHPCYICGKDTGAESGVCGYCALHGARHTEMKDRRGLPMGMVFGEDKEGSPEQMAIHEKDAKDGEECE